VTNESKWRPEIVVTDRMLACLDDADNYDADICKHNRKHNRGKTPRKCSCCGSAFHRSGECPHVDVGDYAESSYNGL
jgi:hypothetical protein